MNNNGNICGNSSPTTDKAECLAHFSHERSNEEVMVVDVQGCGHCLFDPEIASKELMANDELLFCTGNLSKDAINNFVENHKCNYYCQLLDLLALK